MLLITLSRRLIKQRLMLVLALSLVAFLTSAVGGSTLFSAAVNAEDAPLTRADSPDDRLALTFDVTWGTEELTKILSILDSSGVKATFFVGGTFLSNHGEVAKQMAAKGHEIGTLGQMMVNLSQLTEQEITTNLLASQSILAKALGGPVRYFRPPQGPATPEVVRGARAARLITVTHSLDSGDHLERKASEITRRVVRGAGRGDIIHLTASDWSRETAKALPQIIQDLKARGFKLVRISELVDTSQGLLPPAAPAEPDTLSH